MDESYRWGRLHGLGLRDVVCREVLQGPRYEYEGNSFRIPPGRSFSILRVNCIYLDLCSFVDQFVTLSIFSFGFGVFH